MSAIVLPGNRITYKRVAGANPVAGVECSDTVPAGKFWVLLSYVVALVQGLTQTPLPILQIDDGTTVILESPGCSAAQGASTTCQYIWAPNLTLSGQIGATPSIRSTGALPQDLPLPAGYRIRTITQGIGANSDYGAPSIYVAEIALDP